MKFIYKNIKTQDQREALEKKKEQIIKELQEIRRKKLVKAEQRKKKIKAVKTQAKKEAKKLADLAQNKTIPTNITPKIVKIQEQAMQAIATAHEAKMAIKNRDKSPKPKIFKEEATEESSPKEQRVKAARSKRTPENAWLMKTEKKIYRIKTYSTGSIGNKPKMIDNVPTYLSSSYFKEIAAKDLMKELLAMHKKYESSSKEYARIEACNPFTEQPIMYFVSDAWSESRASIAKDMIFKKAA